MGANSGKFYDAAATSKLIANVYWAMGVYKNGAELTKGTISDFYLNNAFKGKEATAAKTSVNSKENSLLNQINDIQLTTAQVFDDINELFKSDVDSDSSAHIDYDTLETINRDFQNLYYNFKSNATSAASRAQSLNSSYSKYGGVTVPDFSTEISGYVSLCGGESADEGYISECMDKLVKFDSDAMGIITDSGLSTKIQNTYDSMNAIMGVTREDITDYNNSFRQFQWHQAKVKTAAVPTVSNPTLWDYMMNPSERDGSFTFPAWLDKVFNNKAVLADKTEDLKSYFSKKDGNTTFSMYDDGFIKSLSFPYANNYKNSTLWQPFKQRTEQDVDNLGEDYDWYKQRATLAQVGVSGKVEYTHLDDKWNYDNNGTKGNFEIKGLTAEAHANANAGFYVYEKDENGNTKRVICPSVNAEIGESASGLDLKADGSKTWGNSEGLNQIGVYGNAEVKVLTEEAKAYVTYNKNEIKLGASAEADVAKVTGEAGVDIAGTDVGVTGSLKVGVGAHVNLGYTDGKVKFDLGVAVGVGFDVGIDIDCSGTIAAVCDTCESAIDYFF